jgi:hypothetical protein
MDQKALVDRYREEANTTSLKETKMKDMKQLLEILSFSKNKPTFAKCVELARDFMFRLHRDNILDLTHNFPKDAMKDGKPFCCFKWCLKHICKH